MALEGKAKGFALVAAAVILLIVWWVVMQASAKVGIEANRQMLDLQSLAADVRKKELDNLERESKLKQASAQVVVPADGGSGLPTIKTQACEGLSIESNPIRIGRFQAPAGCAVVIFEEKTTNVQWWGETRFEHPSSGRACNSPAECVTLIGDVVDSANDKRMKMEVGKGGFFMNWGSPRSST